MTDKFYNIEYEKILLGMLLLDNSIIDIVTGRISAECFYDARNKLIYETIIKQWNTDHCVNLVTIVSAIERAKDYIVEMSSEVPSSANWEFYVTKIREYYLARTFRNELSTTLSLLDPDKVNTSIANLETKLSSFMQYGSNDGAEVKNLCLEIPNEIQAAQKSNKKYLGFESGFEQLDELLDGFQTSQLYVIGARPSIGKTAFALTLLRNLSRINKTGATKFSLEMSSKQCFYRMLSSESNLPMWQLKKGTCLEYKQGMTKLMTGLERLFKYDINIVDIGANTDEELFSRIRYEAVVKHKKIFVIDHLGLIQSSKPTAQHYLDVGRITSKLHALAKELDICIILLCQMNREAEGKKPNMSLIRESGNIEQDADVIMFLHRERETNESNIPTDVIVEKNRDGKIGTVHFIFDTNTQNFRENISEKKETAPVIPVTEKKEVVSEEELPF